PSTGVVTCCCIVLCLHRTNSCSILSDFRIRVSIFPQILLVYLALSVLRKKLTTGLDLVHVWAHYCYKRDFAPSKYFFCTVKKIHEISESDEVMLFFYTGSFFSKLVVLCNGRHHPFLFVRTF